MHWSQAPEIQHQAISLPEPPSSPPADQHLFTFKNQNNNKIKIKNH